MDISHIYKSIQGFLINGLAPVSRPYPNQKPTPKDLESKPSSTATIFRNKTSISVVCAVTANIVNIVGFMPFRALTHNSHAHQIPFQQELAAFRTTHSNSGQLIRALYRGMPWALLKGTYPPAAW